MLEKGFLKERGGKMILKKIYTPDKYKNINGITGNRIYYLLKAKETCETVLNIFLPERRVKYLDLIK